MGKVMEKGNICLKLLVDSKAHRVLFAETGKDFVDFLFNLLKLPIGCFVGQPSIKSVCGSLGNIIPIMKNSGSNYMQLNELGNVQDIMTWMITDNLFVTPSSAAFAIPVLKALKPQIDAVEERIIDFQISDLEHEFLLVSLKSETVLTDIFLRQTGWRKSKDGENCSVKLIVDNKAKRVLFVEAGKDFFCFLISLLQLPTGTIINRTTTDRSIRTMVGCIGNIYRSVKNLNEAYMHSNQTKDELLLASGSKSWSEALQLLHELTSMSEAIPNKLLDSDEGYVKGLITYMVTDNLFVRPLSLISGLSKLNMVNNPVSTSKLEVRTVEFGVNEALKFVEVSLRSETVLSDVFLGRNELAVVAAAN
ncbi:uncharacterized protein LOC107763974 [Nicotiana tabacum]|uniref:DUF674 family protein n=2 Tax=Nicotiana TaxID=4085 RepID=A0A1S3XDW3_TOBAC|nr:PREDICTED: uncharacterized protein LOC104239119 [Nicotiana sylvestris]XP_009791962.1 PREDICTED: uncharacterized protein LOC104239119 [Nicotiana sylvestris]XP_009791963.1 PREDICTED: uncharacterized protein LOC104239119 [Nicotiana sylvestris]XP_016437975.1 PREDICTED: uncharacterized protein LOC107763974 [Nicotiana tabacum]XP_016437976.1 PREDICTED: uncharacterized protein LOC107763974 [Nicotiana tabacum]XP_016437978.1 PREDICTED: uncharacterized protein LOC107763974 [Nicotiana tabacum]